MTGAESLISTPEQAWRVFAKQRPGRSTSSRTSRRNMWQTWSGAAGCVVLAGTLLLGCDLGPEGDFLSGSGEPIVQDATAADLQNRTFTFANGRAFGRGLRNQEVTLTFADFNTDGDNNPQSGPFTLSTEAFMAAGVVTIGSCTFHFRSSTFPANQGPQAEEVIEMDPCQIFIAAGNLQLVNAATQAMSLSE